MKYKPNTGYTDCNGKFHHSKCLFIIKTSSNNNSKSEKCKFCVTLISTCNKKKQRNLMARKTKFTQKRIHMNVTPSKTDKLNLLKQQNNIYKKTKKKDSNSA